MPRDDEPAGSTDSVSDGVFATLGAAELTKPFDTGCSRSRRSHSWCLLLASHLVVDHQVEPRTTRSDPSRETQWADVRDLAVHQRHGLPAPPTSRTYCPCTRRRQDLGPEARE